MEGLDEDADDHDPVFTTFKVFSEVLSAKPSPFSSSINIGSTTDVPFLPGLSFPYFQGIIAGDPKFIKDIITRLFFRNFANTDASLKEACKTFRSNIGTFAYTPQGLVLQHLLKGIDLSLDTQTQLFAMFDGDRYLGFCLLGGGFSIHTATGWVEPLEPSVLAEHLMELSTHRSRLESVATRLSHIAQNEGGHVQVQAEDIDTGLKLARMLGRLDISGVNEGALQDLEKDISHLSFRPKYRTSSLEHIIELLERLTIRREEALPADLPVYFPPGQLHRFGSHDFTLLCSFGSRAPSLWSSKGTEYSIYPKSEPDHLSVARDNGEKALPVIIVGMKVPHVAADEWKKVLGSKKMRFDVQERAKEARNLVFKGKGRDDLWDAIRRTVGEVTVAQDKGKKRAREDDDVSGGASKKSRVVNFDEIF